jgi:hypothetical protein
MTFERMQNRNDGCCHQDVFAVQVLLGISAEWLRLQKNQQHSEQTQKYD